MMGTSLVANGVHSMGHLVEPRGDTKTSSRVSGSGSRLKRDCNF